MICKSAVGLQGEPIVLPLRHPREHPQQSHSHSIPLHDDHVLVAFPLDIEVLVRTGGDEPGDAVDPCDDQVHHRDLLDAKAVDVDRPRIVGVQLGEV